MRYTIQPGDTLSELAVRFNTTTEALASANNIKNPNLIYAGDTIIVPGPATGSVGFDLWGATKRFLGW